MSGTMERFREELQVENAVEHIKFIMKNLNLTITKAMSALNIPESEYAMYEELVRRSEAAK